MFDYLEKFNNLPEAVRNKISNPKTVAILSALEKEYGLELAVFVMRVVVGDFKVNDLSINLAAEFGLSEERAKKLALDLKERIFHDVSGYLKMEMPSVHQELLKVSQIMKDDKHKDGDEHQKNVEQVIAEISGLLADKNLVEDRAALQRVLDTLRLYLRGVKTHEDTVETLVKPLAIGGLALHPKKVDDILLISAGYKQKLLPAPPKSILLKPAAGKRTFIAHNLTKLLGSDVLPPAPMRIIGKEIVSGKPAVKTPVIEKKPEIIPPKVAMPIKPDPIPVKKPEPIKPQSMNPIDELQFMSLQDFRRLGETPIHAVEKIRDLIEIMATEDFNKKLAAISAWRLSPVNKLYLAAGSNNNAAGVLSKAEFDAILILNRSLRF